MKNTIRRSRDHGGAAFAKGIKVIRVKQDAQSPGVSPDAAHVRDGSYPLSRPLLFYLHDEPAGDIGMFVDWVLSPAGQAVVNEVGYFSVT